MLGAKLYHCSPAWRLLVLLDRKSSGLSTIVIHASYC